MGKSKVPFKTNVDQSIPTDKAARIRRAKHVADSLAAKRGPIRATEVDLAKEQSTRIRWLLKWVLLLPLSVYGFSWFLLLLVDLFKA